MKQKIIKTSTRPDSNDRRRLKMKLFFKFILAFLALTGAVTLMTQLTHIEFSNKNYWDYRGPFFLFFVTLFPRLTLLFSSVAFGGILWWLGFIFTPRILVACLATLSYWHQNPVLVIISWLIAIGGESSEKVVFVRRPMRSFHRRRPITRGEVIDIKVEHRD